MATIKSYTDLEQSKKLAEILPLESADMYYPWYIEEDGDTIESGHRITTPNVGNFTTHKVNKMILPCWSLAALLNVLPTIDDRNVVFCKDIRCDKWHVFYHGTATLPLIDTERYHDVIDACVAIIEKLHELNML